MALASWITAQEPVLAAAPVSPPRQEPLRIGVLAFRPKPETQARWQPLADYLSHSLGDQTFVLEACTYPELEEGVATSRLAFIFTQPAHYILLTYRKQLSAPLATLVEKEERHALDRFGGVIFTRANWQNVTTLADLRGKILATSAIGSLGGYMMQAYELRKAGIHLPGDLQIQETGQPQDRVVQAVREGRADVGFVRTGVLEALEREGKLALKELNILNPHAITDFPFLLSTPLYPEWPFVAMPDIQADTARRVAAALLSMPHDGAVARTIRIEGFTIPGNYRPVHDLLHDLRLPPFDGAPNFTLRDIWDRYSHRIAGIALVGSGILLLISMILARTVSRLKIERARVRDSLSQLSASQTQLRKLSQAVEQSPECVVITDVRSCIEYVNAAFVRTTGYDKDEVLGHNPSLLQSTSTPPETYASLWTALAEGKVWQGEFINRRKNGQELILSAIIAPVREASGEITHFLAVEQDITGKKQAEAEIHRLAYYDRLTGLPNHTLLLEHLEHSLAISKRRQQHNALILFNIDRFKTLNDAWGSAMGDKLLLAVGGRLAGLTREGDTLSRLGGDEFVLLVQDIEPLQESSGRLIMATAEKIHSTMKLPFIFGQEEVTITCTLSITLYPQDQDDSPQDVVQRAQTALHRVKEAGGNQTAFFDTAMGQLAQQRFFIERELRRGIPLGELELYLQPQVKHEGTVVGAEVLVRWQHPGRGLLPPGQFISVAEESDLIVDLETWVLSETCTLMALQESLGRPLRLAVNISPRHFRQVGFVPWLKDLILASGINPSYLTLEVTEGMVIDNLTAVVAKMTELVKLGIRFSVDDFGTGYSSLAYLKRLPIHEIKIDKSFIQDIPGDPNDVALVETILSVARHLQLNVVAEGVETLEQAAFLRSRANITLQGYLFGRPQSAHDWLQRWAQEPPMIV